MQVVMSTCSVTCFCRVDLLVVELISEDLAMLLKKKSFVCFPCPEIFQGDKLVRLYISITAKPQCKSSSNL